LCSSMAASSLEISVAVPSEDIFLLLVRTCGVIEAKYWADALGLPNAHSYGLIEPLLYGPGKQFAKTPDVVGKASLHRRRHA
jgi:hypothetical protein